MAARTKRGAPPPLVQKTSRGLVPVTAADAELLSAFPADQVFDLVPRRRPRSSPQLAMYWAVLGKVVEATGEWPRPEYLHDFLVRSCGFTREVLNPITEQYETVRDSIAFDAMDQAAMNDYCTAALAALGAWLGIDPLDLLPKRRERRHDAAA